MTSYANDTALFKAFRDGEPGAEKTVFSRYFKSLCLYAEGITGDTIGTEDIVIESFQKTWERRADLPTLSDFRRFYYHIVRNACISRSIARRRHAGAHAQIQYLHAQDVEDTEMDEREILRAELLQEIYQEIEGLPDRCRTIFKLLFLHRQTTDQIATQLGLNVQTVRTQKARAIELIRTRLLRKGRVLVVLLLYSLLGNR
jgi:RNA polymerase sigma factor (sigma-70 family)